MRLAPWRGSVSPSGLHAHRLGLQNDPRRLGNDVGANIKRRFGQERHIHDHRIQGRFGFNHADTAN